MDTLQDLRLFTRVVRAGSLSAAGRETGLSAASVWRHLNALEQRLGAPLLLRSNRGIKLTDAGAAFAERAEAIIAQFDEAAEAVSAFQAAPRGSLRVHASVAIGMNRIAPALPSFLRRYPDISVDLWITQETPNIEDNKIDISVRFGRQPDSALITRKLVSIPRVVIASPAYLAGRAVIRRPTDLRRHDGLLFRFGPAAVPWSFMDERGAEDVLVPPVLESNTVEPLRLAALAGLGVTLLPEWWVADDIAAGRLQVLLEGWEASATGFDSNIYAVWHRGRQSLPKIRAFIDFLVEIF